MCRMICILLLGLLTSIHLEYLHASQVSCCVKNKYGKHCLLPCHCLSEKCDKFSGSCPGACQLSWTGSACHMKSLFPKQQTCIEFKTDTQRLPGTTRNKTYSWSFKKPIDFYGIVIDEYSTKEKVLFEKNSHRLYLYPKGCGKSCKGFRYELEMVVYENIDLFNAISCTCSNSLNEVLRKAHLRLHADRDNINKSPLWKFIKMSLPVQDFKEHRELFHYLVQPIKLTERVPRDYDIWLVTDGGKTCKLKPPPLSVIARPDSTLFYTCDHSVRSRNITLIYQPDKSVHWNSCNFHVHTKPNPAIPRPDRVKSVKVKLVPRSTSSLDVEWTAPKYTNLPLQRYEVKVQEAQKQTDDQNLFVNSTSVRVSGLGSCTEYNISVLAVTKLTEGGSQSLPTSVLIKTPVSEKPEVKERFVTVSSTKTMMKIYIHDCETRIHRLNVLLRDPRRGEPIRDRLLTDERVVSFSDLETFTQYTVEILVNNGKQSGDRYYRRFVQQEFPSAPRNLTITRSSDKLLLQWLPSNGNVTSYIVNCTNEFSAQLTGHVVEMNTTRLVSCSVYSQLNGLISEPASVHYCSTPETESFSSEQHWSVRISSKTEFTIVLVSAALIFVLAAILVVVVWRKTRSNNQNIS